MKIREILGKKEEAKSKAGEAGVGPERAGIGASWDPGLSYVRTDLAVEARDIARQYSGREIPGVESETDRTEHATVTRVKIMTEEAERLMGKVRGNYVTIESPELRSKNRDIQEELAQLFARELNGMLRLGKDATIMCCGLGNWHATPDALGPRVLEYLMVTRHLYGLTPPELRGGMRSVCAIAPGVLGITGMETGEIIQGIVEKVKPDLVIVVDALAARSTQRVGTTIQMGDTGIHPGSGVGNRRFGITPDTLGVPVIAIGIPTVVDAITIASDAMDLMASQLAVGGGAARGVARGAAQPPADFTLTPDQKRNLIRQVLSPYMGKLIVTPKEIDDMIDDIAKIVAGGLNAALHPNIDFDEILEYLS
ncbi:MAG TPA: GPR endopeptidase [Firmicutes bacterium]|nr:GPR endopeptidase [Bacillota bacterium]